jgi:hypothetical protein
VKEQELAAIETSTASLKESYSGDYWDATVEEKTMFEDASEMVTTIEGLLAEVKRLREMLALQSLPNHVLERYAQESDDYGFYLRDKGHTLTMFTLGSFRNASKVLPEEE